MKKNSFSFLLRHRLLRALPVPADAQQPTRKLPSLPLQVKLPKHPSRRKSHGRESA